MPRQRRDGKPIPKKRTVKLTDAFVHSVKPEAERVTYYDTRVVGFALRVEPSGARAYKFTYRHRTRPRWFSLGKVSDYPNKGGAEQARKKCEVLKGQMAADENFDPQANRVAERSDGTFSQDLAEFLTHCGKKLKAPEQKARLLNSVFLGAWESTPTKMIVRTDVKHVLEKSGRTPSSRDAARRHLSSFFSWARREDKYDADNPCTDILIEDSKVKSRDRTLAPEEMPVFWNTLDTVRPDEARALKVILLTGQRPGEVERMRYEDIRRVTVKLPKKQRARLKAEGQLAPEEVSGFVWAQPAQPDETWKRDRRMGVSPHLRRGWRGTKNAAHDVWLPAAVVDLIGEGKGQVFMLRRAPGRAMSRICAKMGVVAPDKITAHDLRRSFASTITWAGFSQEQMGRILNHKTGGVTGTYDRAERQAEAWEIMNTVVAELLQRAKAPSAETIPA